MKYSWNAENQMISAEPKNPSEGDKKTEYLYDYMGRRARKQIYVYSSGAWNQTTEKLFVYDVWNLVKEITKTGGTSSDKFYVWGLDLSQSLQGAGGIGGLVCAVHAGEVRHFFYDANGNVGQVVNETGSIVAHYEYDPFGNALVADGIYAQENPFRFSTKYFDAETGLYYYGFRYYSAELGRWWSRDPIEEEGGINLYLFTSNNGINLYDINGLFTIPPGKYEEFGLPIDHQYIMNIIDSISLSRMFDGISEKIISLLPHSVTAVYFDARLAVVPLLPPAGTAELIGFINGEVHRCKKDNGNNGFMFLGELGLELNVGIGTSIGGNSGVIAGEKHPYNPGHVYYRNDKGRLTKTSPPTVLDSNRWDATTTRFKIGLNYSQDCVKCENIGTVVLNFGFSGFASYGIGEFSAGVAFDYPLGTCTLDGGCDFTIWKNTSPTKSVVTRLGTGARVQLYGRGIGQVKRSY